MLERHRTLVSCAAVAGLAFLVACGGGGEAGGGNADTGADTAAAPAATANQAPAQAPSEPTPQMIALGDSIFHGQAANGICFTCHGQDAKGGQLAPDLTDTTWLNTDGTYAGIIQVVHPQAVPRAHAGDGGLPAQPRPGPRRGGLRLLAEPLIVGPPPPPRNPRGGAADGAACRPR